MNQCLASQLKHNGGNLNANLIFSIFAKSKELPFKANCISHLNDALVKKSPFILWQQCYNRGTGSGGRANTAPEAGCDR